MAESDSPTHNGAAEPECVLKQRAKRDSMFLLTSIIRETGEELGPARVRNVSATGLMADCDCALAKDDRLIIPLRGIGQVSGHVAWTLGNRVGVAFDQPIDPQLTRKSVQGNQPDNVPAYLRYLSHGRRRP